MPRSLFWYANMTNQPMATYAEHTKAWRLIMRSMVFMKCEEKEKAPSNLNFERFYCQENLVHYWLSVSILSFCEGHLFLFSLSRKYGTRTHNSAKHHDCDDHSLEISRVAPIAAATTHGPVLSNTPVTRGLSTYPALTFNRPVFLAQTPYYSLLH
jgi:hypothetical protein